MRDIINKIESNQRITPEEALKLYLDAPLDLLGRLAQDIRNSKHNPEQVTWQIDRNINITNVCVSGCKFCNFHCRLADKEIGYITTMEQYRQKIDRLLELGGDQILLQGGMHPKLDITFYEELFSRLKEEYPTVKLHALGPPEILHISRISKISIEETLQRLVSAGLESLPGAGAEILDSDIRRQISPGKCSAEQWLEVMGMAQGMGLATSATMMYGHIEQPKDIIAHLFKYRDLQDERGDNPGFLAFIAWPFCSSGTRLEAEGVVARFSPTEYLRLVAISRIVLDNIPSIQASWLTVGVETAQVALHYGANDMGSIMIEENVVSSAGSYNTLDSRAMVEAIKKSGFTPRLRDQSYRLRDESFLLL